ncbi:hypothetical protein DL98DRAFT_523874 [Cadophora sp. DSE1049]|nr:hypothetical protein DL98DRAFT_523874 [Cadophora sp. DSE1049]
MASPMDLDVCSSPFKDDEDDGRSCSMSISSDGEEISSFTCAQAHTTAPVQLPSSEQLSNCSPVSPTTKHDIILHLTTTSLNNENIGDTDDTEFTQSQSISHYQTRWTYTCNHMLIHDDEDPFYPIRFGPRQLHKISTELCPLCKELAASAEENRKKKALKEGGVVKDPPIYGIINEDILAESTTRRDALNLAILTAQCDEMLRYAQFLDSDTEPSAQAWEWYTPFNQTPLPSAKLNLQNPHGTLEDKFAFVQGKANLLLQAHIAPLGREEVDPADERALGEEVRAEILRRCRLFHDVGRAVEDLRKDGRGSLREGGVEDKCLEDVWGRLMRFLREEE